MASEVESAEQKEIKELKKRNEDLKEKSNELTKKVKCRDGKIKQQAKAAQINKKEENPIMEKSFILLSCTINAFCCNR